MLRITTHRKPSCRNCEIINSTDNQRQDNQLPATFNRLAWSNLAAQSAEQIALAAAPIVAVLLLGVGEGQTGLLQTALTLPFVLFAIPAGLLADRFSRRWLMTGAEALRAAALFATLLLIWLDWLTLPLLALLGFVAVCGTVAYSVAAPALVPSLVSPKLLPVANARIELARTVAFAGGPPWAACWWDGSVLRRRSDLPPHSRSWRWCCCPESMNRPARPAPRRHPMQDIKEGADFVLYHPLLRPVFVTQFVFGAAWFVILAVFVPYAVRQFGVSASGIGTILGMYGVGMVVGALLATRVMRRLPFGTVLALGPVTGFVAAVVVASTTIVPSAAGGPRLLPARGRPDPVGDLNRDLAAIRNPAAAIGTRIRHQYPELWRAAGRRRVGRHCRRALRRRNLPLSRGGDLRRAGAGDPAVTGGGAGAAAGDDHRARQGLAGLLIATTQTSFRHARP